MIPKRFYAILFMILLTGIIFLPVVYAQEDRTVRRYVELLPDADWVHTQNNLADETVDLEKDFINSDFAMPEGKYYGPYVKSSLFEFDHLEDIVAFNSSFVFSSSTIMNGVTDLWVRIPVRGTDYKRMELIIYENDTQYISIDITNIGYKREIQWKETGIYIRIIGKPLFPDTNYSFRFIGRLKSQYKATIYWTIEKYQLNDKTIIEFVEEPWVEKSRVIKEEVELYPAWCFIFTSGLGAFNLFSYELYFNYGEDYLKFNFDDQEGIVEQGNYFSFYLPFDYADEINWRVKLITITEISPPAVGMWLWENPSDPLERNGVLDFWINNTKNHLLFSSPWYLVNESNPGGLEIEVYLYPNKNLTLLAQYRLCSFTKYYYEDYGGVFTEREYFNLPIFFSYSYTTGRWAYITPGQHFTIYDFGWGQAYLFPGETDLKIFLQNGTSIFWSGKLANLVNEFEEWDSTWGSITDIYGLIRCLFSIVSTKIMSIGRWIYSNLVALKDWIISLAKNIWDKASTFMYAILAGLPMVMILFIGSKAGAYIFLGDVDLGAEKATIAEAKMKIRKIIKKGKGKPVKKIKRIEKKTGRYERRAERYKKQAERIRVKSRRGR